MDIEPVDPRDTSWEVDRPVYRVYFWHQPPAPPGIEQASMGYHSDEYRLVDAQDVHEVLEWATASAQADRTFTLYVEHDDRDGLGLIRLAGVDPTEGEATEVRLILGP